MSTFSPFTLSQRDAAKVVMEGSGGDENRHFYLMTISFNTVYGGDHLPQSVYKKLPRLLNGIPLGAGHLGTTESREIRWRFVEGNSPIQTFLSIPLSQTDADECRRHLKDRLITQAQAVFGEVTVKANISLSRCIHYDADLFINDIADSFDTGLHFKES